MIAYLHSIAISNFYVLHEHTNFNRIITKEEPSIIVVGDAGFPKTTETTFYVIICRPDVFRRTTQKLIIFFFCPRINKWLNIYHFFLLLIYIAAAIFKICSAAYNSFTQFVYVLRASFNLFRRRE